MKILSFGGGVQTTALALMCVRGDYERPDAIIFADTGWELKSTYTYIARMKKFLASHGLALHTCKKGDLRADALNVEKRFASMPLRTVIDGKKGLLRRQCTNEYKVEPVTKKIRELAGLKRYERMKESVDLWLGISYDEIHRMKPNRTPWITNEYPLIDLKFSRRDCKNYIKDFGWDLPPKSACIGCPYHSNDYWRALKKDAPDEFEDAVDFDNKIRKHRVAIKGAVYIHRSYKPLGEVDLSVKQGDLFGEECEGMCGL